MVTARTFYEFLNTPIKPHTRWLLGLLIVPLLLSFVLPLWRIDMAAPQYPNGLSLDIYTHKLVAGHDGRDLDEINILNHYIGMQSITREQLRDLDWIPFALGALALLCLRVAVIGTISSLIDLAVITGYVSVVALGRFVYMLYHFGHNLNPEAPIDVEPFTPAIVGVKQVANFTTYSFPLSGSFAIGIFSAGVWVVLAVALISGRRAARAEAP